MHDILFSEEMKLFGLRVEWLLEYVHINEMPHISINHRLLRFVHFVFIFPSWTHRMFIELNMFYAEQSCMI